MEEEYINNEVTMNEDTSSQETEEFTNEIDTANQQDEEDLSLLVEAFKEAEEKEEEDKENYEVEGSDPFNVKFSPNDYSKFMEAVGIHFRDYEDGSPITVQDLGKLGASIMGAIEGYMHRTLPTNFNAMIDASERFLDSKIESSRKNTEKNLLSTRLELDNELSTILKNKSFTTNVKELGLEGVIVGALKEGDKPKIVKLYQKLNGTKRGTSLPSGRVNVSRRLGSSPVDLDKFQKDWENGTADITDLL